jgi:oligosaccharide repeat unit polymerase
MTSYPLSKIGAPVTQSGAIGGKRKRTSVRMSLIAVLGSWLLVFLLHEISIGGIWDPVGSKTWFWLSCWIAAFGSAYLVSTGDALSFKNKMPSVPTSRQISRLVILFSAIFSIGVFLFIFDFAVLRGYGFTNAAAIRFEEVNSALKGSSSISAVSGIGRLIIPAFLPTSAIVVMFWRSTSRAARGIFLVAMFFVLIQQLLFEGGRFLLASTAVIVVFAYLVFPHPNEGAGKRQKSGIPYVRIGLLGMVLASFFAYVFIDRVLERGDYFASAYLQLASSFQITPHYEQLSWFEGPLGGLWFSICMLWLYATQGINELDLILNQPFLEHAHGLYQLPHFGQIILLLTGIDIRYDALANLPTYGSYATLYGHSYVDFGNMGSIIQALFMGYLTGKGILELSRGHTGPQAMAAPIMFTLCLFSPVISLIPTIWPSLFWAIVAGFVLRAKKG